MDDDGGRTGAGAGPEPGWADRIGGLQDGIASYLIRVAAVVAEPRELMIGEVVASAVRGALLADVTLAGRVSEDSTSFEVDTDPTGFAPADELLHSISAHPKGSLERWLRLGRPHPAALTDILVQRQLLRREPLLHHHYRPAEPRQNVPSVAELSAIFDEAEAANPSTAALTVLCAALGYLGPDRKHTAAAAALIAECGAASDVITATVQYLTAAMADINAAGVADNQAIIFGGV